MREITIKEKITMAIGIPLGLILLAAVSIYVLMNEVLVGVSSMEKTADINMYNDIITHELLPNCRYYFTEEGIFPKKNNRENETGGFYLGLLRLLGARLFLSA